MSECVCGGLSAASIGDLVELMDSDGVTIGARRFLPGNELAQFAAWCEEVCPAEHGEGVA